MKMFGSKFDDTMIGTTGIDTIRAGAGDDLLATNGGRDSIFGQGGNDLISGFGFNLNNLAASPARGAFVDGGGDSDWLILDINPAKGASILARAAAAMTIHNVEENIYNVGAVTTKDVIIGSDKRETICTSGEANVRGMDGDDYIFTVDGNDTLSGGDGDDFLSAGLGHNTVSGGAGRDDFQFKVEPDKGYQYTNITDFKDGTDKIAVVVDIDQYNLRYNKALDHRLPDHLFGDGAQGVGDPINDYVSYNNGRHIGANDFQFDASLYNEFVKIDPATGSVLLAWYGTDVNGNLVRDDVLVAHVDDTAKLDPSDFVLLLV